MTTEVIRPNSNISWTGWFPYTYVNIDETTPDGVDIRPSATGFNKYIEHGYGNMSAPTVYEVTSIAFSCYAKKNGLGWFKGIPKIGGSYLSSQNYNSLTTSYLWHTKTWNGSWTKAQVDAMSFKVNINIIELSDIPIIDTIYCTVTYTILAPGYDKTINGIVAVNWDQINGINDEDIDAWNGVT